MGIICLPPTFPADAPHPIPRFFLFCLSLRGKKKKDQSSGYASSLCLDLDGPTFLCNIRIDGTHPNGGRMRRVISIVALTGTLIACDSFSPESVAGTYDLVSINGQTLPFSEPILGSIVTVHASRMWLGEGGDFRIVTSTIIDDGTGPIPSGSFALGTYTLEEPNTIRFSDNTGTGTIDGDRLTLIYPADAVLVFERLSPASS